VWVNGAALLSSWFKEGLAPNESGAVSEILLACAMRREKTASTAVPAPSGLATLPNTAQAYVIRPLVQTGLALARSKSEGFYYAA